jgi:NAD(P)-dependent dehydrogenase (short-subunit alcohol dehydrogenase family)
MPRLEGKIAVITGGSSGIGLATTKRFVKEGAYVFITGRRQTELDKAAAEIGSNVTAVKGDVANPNDLGRLYQTVAAKKGKLDILFANAGIADPVLARGSSKANFLPKSRRQNWISSFGRPRPT